MSSSARPAGAERPPLRSVRPSPACAQPESRPALAPLRDPLRARPAGSAPAAFRRLVFQDERFSSHSGFLVMLFLLWGNCFI